MSTHIAIVGGGVGGTVVANRLMHLLHGDSRHDVAVTIFDERGLHTYQPGWLYIPLTQHDPAALARPERHLLHHHVALQTGDAGKVTRIDAAHTTITTADGATAPYDFLVIATGARNAPEDITGFAEGADHFYSELAALHLREKLATFTGGRIIIGVASIPYRCPPAPLEFTFMLEDALRQRGLRNNTELHYIFPINRVFPIASVDAFARPLLDERGVQVHTFFNVDTIDPATHTVASLEGETLPYDLLVLAPPHRGAQLISDSGLGDQEGWVPTDRFTLRLRDQPEANLFTVGDATDLPVSKSGAAAHFEGFVIAEQIAAELQHRAPRRQYDGRVACFLETGHGQASFLWFNYDHPPRPPHPSRLWHLEKAALNRFYWQAIPPALV
jgi:sulfide:quinone oxidoreductase